MRYTGSLGTYLEGLIPPAWWKTPEEVRVIYRAIAGEFRGRLKATEEYIKNAVETSVQPQMQIWAEERTTEIVQGVFTSADVPRGSGHYLAILNTWQVRITNRERLT